ncbi:hypothetical protein [Domibacillus indicus]|nr:hypothetical protein [Domibacillus indicus]
MPLYEMGCQSVKKMVGILKGKDNGQGMIIKGAELIVRQSTGRR